MNCLICGKYPIKFFKNVEKVDYFECGSCDSIFADPKFIADKSSQGNHYDHTYWGFECFSARERSFGSSLSRVAEVFLYARNPINKFVDIGTGPGYLLDSLKILMPKYSDIFFGIEAFPPPVEFCSKHENFIVGSLGEMRHKFDAGCCIEVIEHLAPNQLKKLIYEMSVTSNRGAIYYFNSAQPSFVREIDVGYLDPHARGHICSYSLTSLTTIFADFGFRVIPLPGRDWGFLAEFLSNYDELEESEALMRRVWSPVPHNVSMLKDNGFGPFMYTAGLEAARCYYESFSAGQRTQWALSLQRQLDEG